MYINPFIAGVLTTVFTELALVMIYAVVTYYRGDVDE